MALLAGRAPRPSRSLRGAIGGQLGLVSNERGVRTALKAVHLNWSRLLLFDRGYPFADGHRRQHALLVGSSANLHLGDDIASNSWDDREQVGGPRLAGLGDMPAPAGLTRPWPTGIVPFTAVFRYQEKLAIPT